MLTANCCLRSIWLGHRLEVYCWLVLMSRCVVCNGDFTVSVFICQLVLVCPGYDRKLPTLSAGANDRAAAVKALIKTTNYLLTLALSVKSAALVPLSFLQQINYLIIHTVLN